MDKFPSLNLNSSKDNQLAIRDFMTKELSKETFDIPKCIISDYKMSENTLELLGKQRTLRSLVIVDETASPSANPLSFHFLRLGAPPSTGLYGLRCL